MAGEPTRAPVEGPAPGGAGVLELREVTKRYSRSGRPAVDHERKDDHGGGRAGDGALEHEVNGPAPLP